MSTSLEAAPTKVPVSPQAAAPARAGKTWLFNPWFDVFLMCFAAWPIIVLLRNWQLTSGLEHLRENGSPLSITFWQVYFLTTPHRWITLALVFGDRDKFAERPRMFIGLAIGALLACLACQLTLGSLALLMAADYIWNAWHFAAQHSGIHRIYGRMSRPDVARGAMFEKVVFRVFALYVLFRIALVAALPEALENWKNASSTFLANVVPILQNADWLLLVCPALLLARELWDWRPSVVGRLVYLVSVLAIYAGALLVVHAYVDVVGQTSEGDSGRDFWANLVLSFALAIAMFHATEYLAIVSWAVRRKRNPSGIFAQLAPMWGMAMVIYLAALGLGGVIADARLQSVWVFLNLVVSFLHYGYDGMIWKQPRPKPQPAAG
jgi:hypothetical protein